MIAAKQRKAAVSLAEEMEAEIKAQRGVASLPHLAPKKEVELPDEKKPKQQLSAIQRIRRSQRLAL